MSILAGKTVLITGGTGSFGKHFTKLALARWEPKAIRIYSRDELKQHDMALQIPDERMRFLIGDVRDMDRLLRALDGVDIVIHAAALKQVPACEYNPFEAVKTNILGTQNVAAACIDAGVWRAIALSTDKAVSPANLYGATKLCAEKLFIQANVYAGSRDTRLACVRYGNVVSSRGSVLPLFQQQAPQGFLTVTDERMTRFWISLDEAVEFVVDSIEQMQGGEVFVPRLPSIRVVDLARAIAPGVALRFTGIRRGEKLHETLLTAEEARHTVSRDARYVIQPDGEFWEGLRGTDEGLLPDGFTYTSDQNDRWLDVSALRSLVARYEDVDRRSATAGEG